MIDKSQIEPIFASHGYSDFKWMKANQIKVAQWVRFKCLFGCPVYGKKGTCPPNVPSIDQCREFFSEYEECVIFRIQKTFEAPEEYKGWGRDAVQGLLAIEREVFLAGHYKAFLISFDSCGQCAECTVDRVGCTNKKAARPGADAMGIDVYATARGMGYPIQVLKTVKETMNRYAFLMIE
jgi:predicted metal-binding protein